MSMKDKYIYPAIFTYQEDGISIEFPDLQDAYQVQIPPKKRLRMQEKQWRFIY